MRNQAIERPCEFSDLIAAMRLQLRREIIRTPYTAHCLRQDMERMPETAAEPPREVCRHRKRGGIYGKDEAYQLFHRCPIRPLAQMHGDPRHGRAVHEVAENGR